MSTILLILFNKLIIKIIKVWRSDYIVYLIYSILNWRVSKNLQKLNYMLCIKLKMKNDSSRVVLSHNLIVLLNKLALAYIIVLMM